MAAALALFTGRLETVAVGAAPLTGATLTGCPVKELSKTPALAIHLLYGTGAVDGCVEVVFVSGLNCTTRAGFSPLPLLLLAFLSALGGIVGVESPSLFVVVVVVTDDAEDELQESLFSSVSAIFFFSAVSSFATAVGGLGALFFFVLGLATASCRLNVRADATEALASSKLGGLVEGGLLDAVLIPGSF